MRFFLLFTLLSLVFAVSNANEVKNKMSLGLEMGGSVSFLFSDIQNEVFGLGMGSQYSISFSMLKNRPIGVKFRLDQIKLREESLVRTDMDHVKADTHLKAMEQGWISFLAGAEGRFKGHGQELFWEAMIGYAFGNHGVVELEDFDNDGALYRVAMTPRSTFAVGGGVGLRREIAKGVIGVASLRTFFLGGSTYLGKLEDRAIIPLPFMFSIGAEYEF